MNDSDEANRRPATCAADGFGHVRHRVGVEGIAEATVCLQTDPDAVPLREAYEGAEKLLEEERFAHLLVVLSYPRAHAGPLGAHVDGPPVAPQEVDHLAVLALAALAEQQRKMGREVVALARPEEVAEACRPGQLADELEAVDEDAPYAAPGCRGENRLDVARPQRLRASGAQVIHRRCIVGRARVRTAQHAVPGSVLVEDEKPPAPGGYLPVDAAIPHAIAQNLHTIESRGRSAVGEAQSQHRHPPRVRIEGAHGVEESLHVGDIGRGLGCWQSGPRP
jgi:hypothetical protein